MSYFTDQNKAKHRGIKTLGMMVTWQQRETSENMHHLNGTTYPLGVNRA
jgi:hypothetical protein